MGPRFQVVAYWQVEGHMKGSRIEIAAFKTKASVPLMEQLHRKTAQNHSRQYCHKPELMKQEGDQLALLSGQHRRAMPLIRALETTAFAWQQ